VKVFLDVGAHVGSTLLAVRDPKYAFDRIVCFEPSAACWPALEALADERVTVCHFGLWDETCERILHDAGSIGASLFADKFASPRHAETARFVRASEWFRANLAPTDEIYLKLNCEGAEFDIVEDLLTTGELARIRSVMIDPDVRKVPSRAHREREVVEQLRASRLTNYVFEQEVMVGATHRDRIQNWLRVAGAEDRSARAHARQAVYVAAEAAHGRRAPLRAALHLGWVTDALDALRGLLG
jgi:FkbM family methyltransferase